MKEVKGRQKPSKIFQLLMSDDLANLYNWGGTKGKKSFQENEYIVQALFGEKSDFINA